MGIMGAKEGAVTELENLRVEEETGSRRRKMKLYFLSSTKIEIA